MNFNEYQPSELEFFAESQQIEIVPNFQEKVLNLVSGDFGPFKPGIPIKVPLWLAVYLKIRSKCKIDAPEWLSVDFLEDRLNEEKSSQNTFARMPFYFEEISSLILKNACDDLKDALIIRGLLEDILNIRSAKLQDKISKIHVSDHYLDLKNLGNMEVNKVKRSVEQSFTVLQRIKSLGNPKYMNSTQNDSSSIFNTQNISSQ